MKTYKRPPIAETVMQLAFDGKLDEAAMGKAAAAIKAEFPQSQPETTLEITMINGRVGQSVTPAGFRLTSSTAQRIVIIRPDAVLFSLLPPYPGWADYFNSAWDVFTRIRARVGYRPVTRVGIRYVNRIDIPDREDGKTVAYGDYLKIHYQGPLLLGMTAPSAYLVQGDFVPPDGAEKIVLRSGTVEPVLIKHSSLLLDIEISAEKDIPQSEAELAKLLHRLRDLKNTVFSDSITPLAEALFGVEEAS